LVTALFWGEFEFQTLATLAPASSLIHIWPTAGLIGWEVTGFSSVLITGFAKLLAISLTVSGGYRGGFIFPLFCAGASFGRAFVEVFPSVSPVVACLCFAASINVAITRTALATTIILASLSGEINAGPPLLAASLVSLFATSYMPFIKTQQQREDIRESQLYSYTSAIVADPELDVTPDAAAPASPVKRGPISSV
jgi:H+/Cl- antiporter ClcA